VAWARSCHWSVPEQRRVAEQDVHVAEERLPARTIHPPSPNTTRAAALRGTAIPDVFAAPGEST
jgi:hypothetical protein